MSVDIRALSPSLFGKMISSGLAGTLGGFAAWERGAADFTHGAVASACGTVLSAVIDHLQMQAIPARFRKESLQVSLGLLNGAAIRQFPALCEPMDVGIDRK